MKATIAFAAWLLALTVSPALAEDTEGADLTTAPAASEDTIPAELTGTLQKVHESGIVTLGYREASFPVLLYPARHVGAHGILDRSLPGRRRRDRARAERHSDQDRLPTRHRRNPNRCRRSGKVDLECGSTTSNIERQKKVSFSPIIYVAGTKLLAKRDSGIGSYHDLTGKDSGRDRGDDQRNRDEAAQRKIQARHHHRLGQGP
ncbi:MAG: transporter substrate-binding domain-containing protein [Aliidongia sp.]